MRDYNLEKDPEILKLIEELKSESEEMIDSIIEYDKQVNPPN